MKTDLVTSIIAAIAGVVIAYFVTNFFTPELQDVTFKTLNESFSASLTDPNDEIFNFRAVNPTVEVYVGQCLEYNEQGECIDDSYQSPDATPDEGEDGYTD